MWTMEHLTTHAQWVKTVWKRLVQFIEINIFPMSSGASEWAQRSARVKRAVQSKQTSERCEQMSERMSERPKTNDPILKGSESQCVGFKIPVHVPFSRETLDAFCVIRSLERKLATRGICSNTWVISPIDALLARRDSLMRPTWGTTFFLTRYIKVISAT